MPHLPSPLDKKKNTKKKGYHLPATYCIQPSYASGILFRQPIDLQKHRVIQLILGKPTKPITETFRCQNLRRSHDRKSRAPVIFKKFTS